MSISKERIIPSRVTQSKPNALQLDWDNPFLATKEYENQISHLSSNLQKYEQLLEETQNENAMLNSALDGARTLNSQLQTSADQATRDITHHVNDSLNRVCNCHR